MGEGAVLRDKYTYVHIYHTHTHTYKVSQLAVRKSCSKKTKKGLLRTILQKTTKKKTFHYKSTRWPWFYFKSSLPPGGDMITKPQIQLEQCILQKIS